MINSWKTSELELIPELENLPFESGNTVIDATGYGKNQHTPEFLPVQDTYPSGIMWMRCLRGEHN